MKIITAGPKYSDIDVYGGITAYAELLRKQGFEAQAVTTAKLNDSISPIIRVWKVDLAREYTPQPNDTYTLIDVSEPGYFEKFVDLDRVDEIIDHLRGLRIFGRNVSVTMRLLSLSAPPAPKLPKGGNKPGLLIK